MAWISTRPSIILTSLEQSIKPAFRARIDFGNEPGRNFDHETDSSTWITIHWMLKWSQCCKMHQKGASSLKKESISSWGVRGQSPPRHSWTFKTGLEGNRTADFRWMWMQLWYSYSPWRLRKIPSMRLLWRSPMCKAHSRRLSLQ